MAAGRRDAHLPAVVGRIARLVVLLAAGLAPAVSAAASAGAPAGPPIVPTLNDAIRWYRQQRAQATAASDPSDVVFFLIGKYGVRVGDRVQVAGVTGDVVDVGLVRLHLLEVGADGLRTGRVVVFSNAVLFQLERTLRFPVPLERATEIDDRT